MKSSIALVAVAAAFAAAQSLSDLPPCGQTCVSNMLSIASSSFGCGAGDVHCYCTNQNFGYGLRDCSNEACSKDDAAKVISFGTTYCQNALASGSVTGAPTTGAALSVLSSALATVSSNAGPRSTAITTSPLVQTITSGGSTILATTGFQTVYSSLPTGPAASAASSISSSAASVAASLSSSAASVASSLSASAASAASSASSAASAGASSAANAASSKAAGSTGSTGGAAPMMTGLPLAGAAGMAALLLL